MVNPGDGVEVTTQESNPNGISQEMKQMHIGAFTTRSPGSSLHLLFALENED